MSWQYVNIQDRGVRLRRKEQGLGVNSGQNKTPSGQQEIPSGLKRDSVDSNWRRLATSLRLAFQV